MQQVLHSKLRKNLCKAVLGTTIGVLGMNAATAACIIDSSTPKTVLAPQIKASERAILTALTQMDTTVGEALDYQTGVVVEGLRTLTAQKALTAQSVGKAVKDNTQLQTAAIQSVETNRKVKEVMDDYGPQGAGHQVCKVQAERQKVAKTSGETKAAINRMIKSEITARPGAYASKNEALATRLALHDKLYCTAGQASSGLCASEGPRAGRSLQAATLFEPADFDSPEYRDKSAFINNMLGLPDNPITPEKAATYGGQAYADMKRRKDAIISVTAVSLKSMQAETSTVPSNHKDDVKADEKAPIAVSEAEQLVQADNMPSADTLRGNNTTPTLKDDPLSVQLKKDVSRYLGAGQEYQDWSKALVSAPERGIMQEILKVKALRLYLQSRQYEQLSRMEAMLAANIAAETYRTGMEDNIERQRQVVMRKNIAQGLR